MVHRRNARRINDERAPIAISGDERGPLSVVPKIYVPRRIRREARRYLDYVLKGKVTESLLTPRIFLHCRSTSFRKREKEIEREKEKRGEREREIHAWTSVLFFIGDGSAE